MASVSQNLADVLSARSSFNGFAVIAAAGMCLCFTSEVVRADDSHSRTGVTARVGSIAGTTEFRGEDVTTVGGQLALGYQLGPLALEAEHERALLLEGRTGVTRGRTARTAVNLRLFAVKITKPFDEGTMLRLYVEGGAGHIAGSFASGDRFARREYAGGGGILLDHWARHRRKSGLRFAGWHLGWSLRTSPPTDMSPSVAFACRDRDCSDASTPANGPDLSLMFSSSINFSW